ncbi:MULTISPECIES: ParB/RepB/Spo0J family partition protein [unclassified Leisingera]|uniref:ParB/RepB/Spo0J family partition protein n=1 Tax=unclassified Leisingera TaxID=2614906 RepID=UPI0013E99589|nr:MULTISPECIES: ParB/RepB/Spo0J family partition protein [unclassified Leisingera]
MARNMTSTLDKLRAAGKLEGLQSQKPVGGGEPLTIDIDLIEPDPEQPRRHFDPDKLASLSANISIRGVLQPITVQPKSQDGRYIIIMGERRWRAAKMAGLSSVPVLIREATADLRAIQLTENIQRDDLTTMEIALAVEQMRKDGMKRSQIAEDLGWGQAQVSQFFGVIAMPDELQELARNNVPVRALSDLNSLWKKDEQAARRFVSETPSEEINRVTVAGLRAEVEAGQGVPPSDAPPQEAPAEDKKPNLAAGLSALSGGNPQSDAQGGKRSSNGQVAILCQQGDQIGRILTDRKAKSNKALMVSFENGERIEEVALTDIVLFEVIEL